MTSDNHARNREFQQDARAWAAFTGTSYTAALRQMDSPLAQGLLGERVSARYLIAALDHHEVIGARGGSPRLGENGVRSAPTWSFNGETDFIGLALIADMLRMFTPIPDSATPEVGSYSLKHTAEAFLDPHCSYVSNGRLIWAAAALGLPISDPDRSGPNLLIGVPELEHDYVRRMTRPGQTRPKADHHCPAGYGYLQTVLARAAAGERITGAWVRPAPVAVSAPFHDWLILQAGRDSAIGDLASDYVAGVRDSDHRIARTPDELLAIFHEVPHSPEAYDAVVSAIAEWMRAVPSAAPVRTEPIGGDEHAHRGWGAGAGTVERYEYRCPCGDGEVIEEHDNVPGFREHDVRIACSKCYVEWQFVGGRSVRDWRLVPVAVTATI
jgi:ribosomal protein S27AE